MKIDSVTMGMYPIFVSPYLQLKIRAAVCFLDEATLAHYQQLAAKLQERARKRMRQGHRLLVKPVSKMMWCIGS